MLTIPHRLQQRFTKRPDSEHEQAFVRLIIAVLILSYLSILALTGKGTESSLQSPLFILLCESLVGLGIVVSIALHPGVSGPRRLLGMVADYLTLGALMVLGGASLAPLYVIYLWVTIGNGLRYGVQYLKASVAMAAASYFVVIQFTPYWSENRPLAWGLLLGLVAVPAYLTSLLTALTTARDEARRADAAKTRFLATMSHEFRTPLNGIVSASELLASSPLSAEQRDNTEILQAAAQSLLALVEDVLDIAKIESGKQDQNFTGFSLAGLLRSVELVLRPMADAKQLVLEMQIEPGTPDWLLGDQNHLRQILMNLASNAVKFTERGSVIVSAGPVSEVISGRIDLKFSVRDTGIGIAGANQERIFDAFEQADQGHSRRYGGTGLGTTIAKSLTELLGGTIGLESTHGVGSHFWSTIPFVLPDAATAEAVIADDGNGQNSFVQASEQLIEITPAAAIAVPVAPFKPRLVAASEKTATVHDIDDPFVRHRALGLRPMKILVADDQPANIAILCRVLERAGHRFHQVQSGEEVLSALESSNYDCAIIDLHMPGCSGLDTMRQARVMEAGRKRTSFVILTADATLEAARECEAAGARAFHTKPIVVAKLLDTLREIAVENAAERDESKSEERQQTAIDLVSMTALQELRRMGLGEDFLRLFINECQADAARCISALERQFADGDWDGMREQCHALKGVAANMAAFRLAEDATTLMNLDSKKMASQGRQRIKSLQWCLSATKIALLETLAPLDAAQIDRRGING